MSTCIMCGRPLTDPASIKRGMGPVCAGQRAKETEAMPELPFERVAMSTQIKCPLSECKWNRAGLCDMCVLTFSKSPWEGPLDKPALVCEAYEQRPGEGEA